MEQKNNKFSVFSRVFTSSLLVISCAFGESWENTEYQGNGLNAMRTSRVLLGETAVERAQLGDYAHLKHKIIDILGEDDDAFGKRLNDLAKDDVFRSRFNKLIHDETFQKSFDDLSRSMSNFDLSFDDLKSIDNLKKKTEKKKKNRNSFNLDNFYDDEDDVESKTEKPTKSKMALEKYGKSKKSNKGSKISSKDSKSTSSGISIFGVELKPESLEEMVSKGPKYEEQYSNGFMDTLRRLDKEFEIELIRMVKDKSLSDYEECKYKSDDGKYQHVLRKMRIFLPPTFNMAILMIMLVFKSLFFPYIFTFFSMTFVAMGVYYAYKFEKINRMSRLYKHFNKKGNLRNKSKKH
ncbi:Plasmodium exported protein, unknown function [Plasmodium gonderi]|uniref:Pv-fam-d protein n=1 Tax=Plasmodium gonderi TaxID=77519 RepID=A0A1Y1JDJ6_PLAGO|nr:Plasmodium exported protein, unknown function [Plasmodium gonderi]GAW79395.1 Plasmodium exported protein, unknown function [Plasmodium gonderi]